MQRYKLCLSSIFPVQITLNIQHMLKQIATLQITKHRQIKYNYRSIILNKTNNDNLFYSLCLHSLQSISHNRVISDFKYIIYIWKQELEIIFLRKKRTQNQIKKGKIQTRTRNEWLRKSVFYIIQIMDSFNFIQQLLKQRIPMKNFGRMIALLVVFIAFAYYTAAEPQVDSQITLKHKLRNFLRCNPLCPKNQKCSCKCRPCVGQICTTECIVECKCDIKPN